MESFVIRQATPSDLDSLASLILLFPTPTIPDEGYIPRCFMALLSEQRAYLAVAVEPNGTIVGYVSGYRHAAFYAGGETAWCDEVFVKEEQRRCGAGSQLMLAFELWATQNSCVLVSLATSGAKEFYEALGYATKASYFKKYLSGVR